MAGSDPIRLDEIFRRNGCGPENLPNRSQEQPNRRIQFNVRLNQIGVPDGLSTELWNDHNMALTPSRDASGDIVISGIPPVVGFGAQQLLEVVRKFAPNAEMANP